MPAGRLPRARLSGRSAVAKRRAGERVRDVARCAEGGLTMSLYAKLRVRAAEGRPVRVGLIGAGKFGSMYLAQVPRTPGVHIVGIADLSPDAARTNLARVGWTAERMQAASLDHAVKSGATHIGDDWCALVRHPA